MFQDVTTTDWVVLLKGTIVSCLSNMSPDPVYNFTDQAALSGKFDLMTPSGCQDEGHIYIGLGQDGAMRLAGVDSSYWGYEDTMAGLLIPCNGGNDSQIPYTTDDISQVVTVSGAYVTQANVTAGYTLPLEDNFPVGVLYQDVYQDIQGTYLNYDLNNIGMWGMVFDHVIAIPYVDNFQLYFGEVGVTAAWTRGCWVDDENIATTGNIYNSLRRLFAFLYSPFATARGDTVTGFWKMLRPGVSLKSDRFGKFELLDCEEHDDIAAGTRTTATRDKITYCAPYQTVAKLITTDCRFPKQRLDTVDTFPGSGMPGTETGGLPLQLYSFARAILVACIAANGLSVTPTIKNVVDFVRCGTVGIAYINVQVT
jgi:hypothetical protein